MKIKEIVTTAKTATATPKPRKSKVAELEAQIALLVAENQALKAQPVTMAQPNRRAKNHPLSKVCALPGTFGIKVLSDAEVKAQGFATESRGIHHVNFLTVIETAPGKLIEVIPDLIFRNVIKRWKSQGGRYEAKFNGKNWHLADADYAAMMADFENGTFAELAKAEVESIISESGQPTEEYGQKVVSFYLS